MNDFEERLKSANTVEDVICVFHEEGMDVTEDDLRQLAMDIKGERELNENELDDVAGGGLIGTLVAVGVYFWDETPGKTPGQKVTYLKNWWHGKLGI